MLISTCSLQRKKANSQFKWFVKRVSVCLTFCVAYGAMQSCLKNNFIPTSFHSGVTRTSFHKLFYAINKTVDLNILKRRWNAFSWTTWYPHNLWWFYVWILRKGFRTKKTSFAITPYAKQQHMNSNLLWLRVLSNISRLWWLVSDVEKCCVSWRMFNTKVIFSETNRPHHRLRNDSKSIIILRQQMSINFSVWQRFGETFPAILFT